MSNIQVVAAVYGAVQGSKDVTQTTQDLIDKGNSLKADNNAFGDPAIGEDKHFGMIYKIGNTKYTFACAEHQEVNLNTGTSQTEADRVTASKTVNG